MCEQTNTDRLSRRPSLFRIIKKTCQHFLRARRANTPSCTRYPWEKQIFTWIITFGVIKGRYRRSVVQFVQGKAPDERFMIPERWGGQNANAMLINAEYLWALMKSKHVKGKRFLIVHSPTRLPAKPASQTMDCPGKMDAGWVWKCRCRWKRLDYSVRKSGSISSECGGGAVNCSAPGGGNTWGWGVWRLRVIDFWETTTFPIKTSLRILQSRQSWWLRESYKEIQCEVRFWDVLGNVSNSAESRLVWRSNELRSGRRASGLWNPSEPCPARSLRRTLFSPWGFSPTTFNI